MREGSNLYKGQEVEYLENEEVMLERGTQIAYVPMHAEGDIKHVDVEFGIVVRPHAHEASHYCLYWAQRSTPDKPEMRTRLNCELTPTWTLVKVRVVSDEHVSAALDEYQKHQPKHPIEVAS